MQKTAKTDSIRSILTANGVKPNVMKLLDYFFYSCGKDMYQDTLNYVLDKKQSRPVDIDLTKPPENNGLTPEEKEFIQKRHNVVTDSLQNIDEAINEFKNVITNAILIDRESENAYYVKSKEPLNPVRKSIMERELGKVIIEEFV
jgi:DNA modification methylase